MSYQNEDAVTALGEWREIVGGTINERRPRSQQIRSDAGRTHQDRKDKSKPSQQIRSDAGRTHQDRKDKSKPGPVASPAYYTLTRSSRRQPSIPPVVQAAWYMSEHSRNFHESSRSRRKRDEVETGRRRLA
ncbi:hypothetical protein BHE74_00010537 [Ensete ventricosum]|nr:hypothetical protein GW17_00011454 [Ensete ventricosum]RWW81094.1 hypothetical protein BHE74_00010537 [Ensete ventricosum]